MSILFIDQIRTVSTNEFLIELVEYLEMSLDAGLSLILMQACNEVCAVYIGGSRSDQASMTFRGAIPATVADEIMKRTKAGRNDVEVDGQTYRFVRSTKHFEDRGAVVFEPR